MACHAGAESRSVQPEGEQQPTAAHSSTGPTQGPHSIVDIILAQYLTIGRRKVVKLRSVGREEAAEDD